MRRSLIALVLGVCAIANAQTAKETIEVTATKIAEDVTLVPASVTVLDGDELRARNARDLESALGLTAGISIAPGGDAGPASSVPEMWGLKEFDAFLLVVDGVPWGGAFNPDLPSLDLTGVDRIEIVRGAAPVMYGATSFVGVIHVIHRDPGAPGLGHVYGGSYGTFGAGAVVPLSQRPDLRQSITANFDNQEFRDNNTSWRRGHVLYRRASETHGGTLRFDADLAGIRQSPASPIPRDSDFAPDTNFNPSGARINEDRFHAVVGFDRKPWSTTLAFTHSSFDILRGFLTDPEATPNATGFTQDRSVTDIYFDTHVVKQYGNVRGIFGFDHLYGNARATNGLFDYSTSNPAAFAVDEENALRNRRNFSGLYASTEWTLTPALRLDVGARLNHTLEHQTGSDAEGSDSDSKSFTRVSGAAGITWRTSEALALFANYRNTFKPAAIDFGPEAEADILDPETAHSVEIGAKGRMHEITWTLSAFQMDFSNLVLSTIVDGLPALENGGKERFRGFEFETEVEAGRDAHVGLGFSHHDARFRDFVTELDGVPTNLAGNRLEMSPHNLVNAGFVWTPPRGWTAQAMVNYVGERFLDKRNTVVAPSYTTWSAGVGYKLSAGEIRIDGKNLNNTRPPVSESELGDAQFYRLPARRVEVTYRTTF
ncbi:MAG TPA: TonB-dependent receptor [Thermoanaerobaculia bacterium]|nr:TonB-dependent receptor [Thermoanaerobaculia bacterium]